MDQDVTANDVVAAFVEMAVLVLLSVWGFRTGTTTQMKWLLGMGVPTLAIVGWALFVAPKSVFDVPKVAIVVRVVIVGAGVLASVSVLPLAWAAAFAAMAVVNTALLHVGPFAR